MWLHDFIILILTLFFLNQQFITWHVVVDHGSDYVATYMQSKLTLRYNRERKKRKKEKEREREKQKSNENRK